MWEIKRRFYSRKMRDAHERVSVIICLGLVQAETVFGAGDFEIKEPNCFLSSSVMSINWTPTSYWLLRGILRIQATLEIAFIGREKDGTDASTRRRVKIERNSFEVNLTPPVLMSLVSVPEYVSIVRCISLNCKGTRAPTLGNLLLSLT